MKWFFILIFSLNFNNIFAEKMVPHFYADKIYQMEGDFVHSTFVDFFVFNRGTGNEQRIKLLNVGKSLEGELKYKICFKVKQNCLFECEATLIGKSTLLSPIAAPEVYSPEPNGSFKNVSENNCH